MDSPKPSKKSRRPGYPTAIPYHDRSGRTKSLDRETGSESESATASRGSRAEVIADSHFEKTHNADSTDRSDETINALMVRLAPAIRNHVEEALLPLVSVLRSREENEQKHREKLLGLEMEKLVLERKKLMFKRRRAAPCLGPYWNSPRSNRHEVRVKKNPLCAAQQAHAEGHGWLRENNKSIADVETQRSVLCLQAEFDSYMMAKREAQKHDFGGPDGITMSKET